MVKHIGPFMLVPFPASGSIWIRHESGEGGPMPLSAFTEEVCPWDQVDKADEEKVRRFYDRHF